VGGGGGPSDARVGERGGGKGLCNREEGEVLFFLINLSYPRPPPACYIQVQGGGRDPFFFKKKKRSKRRPP